MKRPRWGWIALLFAAVALAFVSATAFTQNKTRAIDYAADQIATNASPSIEVLSAARGEARHLYALLRERLGPSGTDDKSAEAIAASQKRLDAQLEDYFSQPTFPGEIELWGNIREGRARLGTDVVTLERFIQQRDFDGAKKFVDGHVGEDQTELSDALNAAIELNARHSAELALQIRNERQTSTRLAIILTVGCVVLTLLATWILVRSIRSYSQLVDTHQRLDRERAAELEQFSGRIAHDILSPIGTVAMTLELVARSGDQEQQKRALERGRAAIARVKRLVEGLLGFARAGARAEAGAHASLGTVVADVVDENRAAAEEAAIELRAEVTEGEVACSAGVLTSLISNLVRNALKYVGEAAGKFVVVRSCERSGRMRIEVVDNGPGLPVEIANHVFEPFVRGTKTPGQSIGLGLATVRKLAESHGGRVGFRATDDAGGGCTFWFEVPLYRKAAEAVPVV
jgi:signal transduction histidine kinase